MNTINSLQAVPKNGNDEALTDRLGRPQNVGQIIANVMLGGETNSTEQAILIVDLAARLTAGVKEIELQNGDYELLNTVLTSSRLKVWIKAVVNEHLLVKDSGKLKGKAGGVSDGD